mmetsp:Transcript_99196/g.145073  ORF Transcript_99196/g.145073 Transcript_99196/m.145073 type:complete len:176 (-) Transcript_99196:511-1038(-)
MPLSCVWVCRSRHTCMKESCHIYERQFGCVGARMCKICRGVWGVYMCVSVERRASKQAKRHSAAITVCCTPSSSCPLCVVWACGSVSLHFYRSSFFLSAFDVDGLEEAAPPKSAGPPITAPPAALVSAGVENGLLASLVEEAGRGAEGAAEGVGAGAAGVAEGWGTSASALPPLT